MKTRGLFWGALMMSAVLAGCSNEEDVMNNEGKKNEIKGDSYVAVNIVNPSAGSRAADDDANGTDAENEVKSALFVFFNENGGFVDASEVKGEDLSWEDGTAPASKISSAVIVLEKPETYPTSVVALLNTGLSLNEVKGKSLSQIKDLNGDYINTTNGFAMSNSAYKDGDKEIIATPLSDANIQSSEELAMQNPVIISVERVLAKVSVAQSANLSVTGKDVKLDGATATLVPEIVGYQIVQTNPKSYLLKNIDGITATWNWNDAANFRSYWANSFIPDAYTFYSYNDVVAGSTNMAYCHENTDKDAPTTLLVAAKIKAEGAQGDAVTIIKYKGMYYTELGLNTYINSQLSDCFYTVDANNSSVAKNNDWSNYIKVQASSKTDAKPWAVEIVLDGQPDNATAEEMAAAQAVIDGLDEGMQWTNGDAYFFVELMHNVDGQNMSAVVRNHFYQLSVNSISGLGTPVYEPTDKIEIFEKPSDEEYYIAAKIQVLKWNVVSQGVELQ